MPKLDDKIGYTPWSVWHIATYVLSNWNKQSDRNFTPQIMLLKIRNVLCQWWRAESFSINFLTFLLPHFSLVIPFYYKNNISCEFSFSILTHIICSNGSVSWKGQKTISVFGKTIPQHNDFIIWLKNNPFPHLFITFYEMCLMIQSVRLFR